MTSYMLLVERIAALKAEIERKDEALKKIAEHATEMDGRCEMAFTTREIAEKALKNER